MQSVIEVHEQKPQGFSAKIETSACYLEREGKLLVLQSSSHKSEKNLWGVPAGKIEKGETPLEGAVRELAEETGIKIEEAQARYLGALYIRRPDVDFVYHVFQIRFEEPVSVRLSAEHQGYLWVPFEDLDQLPLFPGAKEAAFYYQKRKKICC